MWIFKDIPNYSWYYQVSDEWIVTSVQRLVPMKNGKSKLMPAKIIKPDIKNWYYSVCFSKDNIKKSFRVNRLVAAVFHPLAQCEPLKTTEKAGAKLAIPVLGAV